MHGLQMTMQAACLRQIPQEMPQAQDFELQQRPVPLPGDGQLRVQVKWLSLDPFLRAQPGGRYALPCPPLGSNVPGYGIATVREDRSGRFTVGEIVTGMTGWAEQAVLDAAAVSRVDATLAPVSTPVGVLAFPASPRGQGCATSCSRSRGRPFSFPPPPVPLAVWPGSCARPPAAG